MEKKIYGIIYLLIDGTNDFEYVGQTTQSLEQRFHQHKYGDQYIDHAIQKHGEDMFVKAILKVCYSKEELDYWERHFIKSRDTMAPNGYNLTAGGSNSSMSCDKSRAKLSATKRSDSPYKNLICEMDKENLSFRGLAKLLGLSHTSISDKIYGKQNFTSLWNTCLNVMMDFQQYHYRRKK